MDHDRHVNKLNKGTYKDLVESINEQETITESRLKMIIISRFLERMGDHLVNIAGTYLELLSEIDR
ncbi:PhoU domain-containing protein [Bacillus sp. N9]